MSNIPINLSGTVATVPDCKTLPSGRACASFRMAVNHWRLDKSTGEFVEEGTSWFGIDCYGPLASNCGMSLKLGMQVVVQGRLKIREWTSGDKSGRTPTVVADHIGPDLRYGTANYQKAAASGSQSSQTSPTSSEQSPGWGGLDTSSNDAEGGDAGPGRAYESESTSYQSSDDQGERTADGDEGATVDEARGVEDKTEEPTETEEDAIARATTSAAAPF